MNASNMKSTLSVAVATVLVVCGFGIRNAFAYVYSTYPSTLNLNALYAGTAPILSNASNDWWLQAVLSQTDSATYSLTLSANLADSQFVGGGGGGNSNANANKYQIGWAFDLLPSGSTLNNLACKSTTYGVCASQIVTNGLTLINAASGTSYQTGGIGTGPVPGSYDLAFYWPNRSMKNFSGTQSVTYTFDYYGSQLLNFYSGAHGYGSVAHVQNINVNGQSCSGWIVNNGKPGMVKSAINGNNTCTPLNNVPEPSELPMMAFGLALMLAGWSWSRRRKV